MIRKVMKESFINSLLSANYYSLFTTGSTDGSVLEQEVIYVLYLSKQREPVVKFFSIKIPEHTNEDGLKQYIENAFHLIGIGSLHQCLVNLSIDGASVNTGLHKTHYFNHNLLLGVKDNFDKTFLKEVYSMLLKLYYLYR